MFRILSKESNIFSIPIYIFFLILMVLLFNIVNFRTIDPTTLVITLVGIALGYFTFNSIGLSLQNHLALVLYSVFVFGFYTSNLDIGLAVALLTNSFLILILTNTDVDFARKSIVLVGSIVALNLIFLPATWPTAIFVLLHIISTSDRIGLQIFRYFFGISLVGFSYLMIMFSFGYREWNEAYFPFFGLKINTDFSQLLYLIPVAALLVYSVIDHFANYNKKSPDSRYKYTFILVFALAQLITILLYMGKDYSFLLLLAIPASIMLSRLLRFQKKYWQKEVGLWLIIFCTVMFKISDIW